MNRAGPGFVLCAIFAIHAAVHAQQSIRTHEGPCRGGAFGTAILAMPDLDGDAVLDYAVSDPGRGAHPGTVDVFSGASGAKLYSILGSGSGSFGHALDCAGDANRDGVDDLVVADPQFDDPNQPTALEGAVWIYSGSDGSIIRAFYGAWGFCRLGTLLSRLDDVDADGVP